MEGQEFSFPIVKFQTILKHPAPYISDACFKMGQGQLLGSRITGSLTGKVYLGIICIQGETSVMRSDDISNWQCIYTEQNGSYNGALGTPQESGVGVD